MTKKSADYPALLAAELPPPEPLPGRPLVLDLFAGCGGLALGFEAVGFATIGFEMLGPASKRTGRTCSPSAARSSCGPTRNTRPGSGSHRRPALPAFLGQRAPKRPPGRPDAFPAFLSAVERLRPRLAVFENVRGMMYQNRTYFDSIVAALRGLGYEVDWKLLNAVDYGVPQNRERLFVAAHKGGWDFPEPTHKGRRVTAGEALGPLAREVPPDSAS